MEAQQILTLLEQLDDEIDDLEEALLPVTKHALVETASKLPLLDKAKLYVLVTYAIESILFSYLRLHGVKAREHPVFRELTRVKQYFDKIKTAENPVAARPENASLDKKAAGRFVKAGLSGNDQYDRLRAEQQAKEKAKAQLKLKELSKKRKSESVDDEKAESATPDDSSDTSSSEDESAPAPKKKRKTPAAVTAPEPPAKKKGRKNKKSKTQE